MYQSTFLIDSKKNVTKKLLYLELLAPHMDLIIGTIIMSQFQPEMIMFNMLNLIMSTKGVKCCFASALAA